MRWNECEKELTELINNWRVDLGELPPDEADYSSLVDSIAGFIHTKIQDLQKDIHE